MWCNVKITMGLGSITFLLRLVFLAVYLLQTCDTAVNTISEINVARGKHTEQSSTWNDHNRPCSSNLAVDGNTDNDFDHGSCTHTEPGLQNPYWSVDLGQEYWISRIEITNRNDNQDRLKNFAVLVGVKRTEMVQIFQAGMSTDLTGNIPITVPDPRRGRYVNITVPGDILTLCEVMVFVINIARGKQTEQSSTWLDNEHNDRYCNSSLAVDGNTDNNFDHGSCTHTVPGLHNPYWSVDLGQAYWITGIEITNRKILAARLQNFTVFAGVSRTEMVQIFKANVSTNISGTISIPFRDPQRGRFVNITVPDDILTLCEVMVFGISDIVCNPLQKPGHGHYNRSTLQLVYPSTLVGSCDAGYQLPGSRAVRQCQKDGTWSGAPPQCSGIACATLNKPENGHYDHGATTLHYPANATVTCAPGYQVSPPGATRHCQTDGRWSGPGPQCTGIPCNPLSNLTHGNYYLGPSPLLFPSNVTVTCDPGYRLLRSKSVRTCQTDGTWSGSEPQCTGITCAALNNPQHGHYDHGTSTLQYPANAKLTCDPGYEVSHSAAMRQCLPHGSWSGPEPQCTAIKCNGLQNPQNGHYNRSSSLVHYPSSVMVTCDPGFRLSTVAAVRHCQSTGKWTGPEPQCTGVLCANLTNPQHGHYDHKTSPLYYPTNATLKCDPGYHVSPSGTVRHCQKDGSWSEPEPQCTVTVCSEPPIIPNGQYLQAGEKKIDAVLNTSLEFHCNSGFTLRIGNKTLPRLTRRCQENKAWSSPEPECIAQSRPPSSLAVVIGGSTAAGVVVVAALVIVSVFFIFKRRRRKFKDDQPMRNRQVNDAYVSVDSICLEERESNIKNEKLKGDVVAKNKDTAYQDREYYSFLNMNKMPPRAIRLEDLSDYVLYSPKSVETMQAQFQSFPAGLHGNHETAVADRNRTKNRYRGIYPYDENRMKLTALKGLPNSDYINASSIDGFSEVRAYIAAQGPSKATVTDFWKMIWEFNVRKVVMLTNLVELKKIKCEEYWPTEDVITFSPFSISLQQEEVFSAFTTRNLTLKKEFINGAGESYHEERIIHQFHFTAWPDKGVPKYTSSLVHFWRKVKNSRSALAEGPVLVHCSAGIGRTGTFIALDWLIDQSKALGYVDPASCVETLRRQRVNMVQTEDQYIFLHQVLVQALVLATSAIPSSEFPTHFSEMIEIDPERGVRKLDVEFEKLTKISPKRDEHEYVCARDVRNRKKNRYSNILPVAEYMPKIPGLDDFYINAVFAPSYKTKETFIITQMPQENTIEDFWRLVYSLDVETIVMMNSIAQTQEDDFYWPDEESPAEFGDISVSVKNSTKNRDREIDTMTLEVKLGIKTKVVKQFRCQYWPEQATVPPSPSRMLEQLELVLDWQQQTGNNPIVVHCMNGAERSGLYCVVSSVIERLRIEQDVAIPQVIEQMRNYREQVIPTVEQFRFCHEAVLAYLEQFDNYSNFTAAVPLSNSSSSML